MVNGYSMTIAKVCQQVSVKNKVKTILSDLSLTVNRGEFIAIVGCSGAGKTTLMNIMSGYTKPSKGQVLVE